MNRSLVRLSYLLVPLTLAGAIYTMAQTAGKQATPVQVTLNYPATITAPIPITMPRGTQFTVTLPSNPTTGYSWHLGGALNPAIVKSNGGQFVAPAATNPPMVGQGGKTVWSFTAVGPGTQSVVLNYARPWEKNQAPEQVQAFSVTVK